MKKPKRRREWRQNSPRDQLVMVFSALEGHASNLEDGVITQTQFHEKTVTLFRWAQELLQLLPDSNWPNDGTKVLRGICPFCHKNKDEDHAEGCREARMQEASKRRPADFEKRSASEQWDIDKSLGCLDWEGF